ncbi:Phage portal protein [Popillia japonica]|uniref:Phage portal protein n=1 Tax=Popillia japonica TaxID=7064 RepID=A0AAW1HVI0_POPJA
MMVILLYKRYRRDNERGFFRKRADPDDGTLDESKIDNQLLTAWLNGEPIDRDKAMNIPTVAGCVQKIADTIANIPICLYKYDGEGIKELKEDKRVFLLNNETGDTLDSNQFKRAMVHDYYMGKGGYAYVRWSRSRVRSIHYVEEKNVSFMSNNDPIFKDFTIHVNGKGYYPHQFIMLLRNTKDGMQGKSLVTQNQKLFGTVYEALLFENYLVASGGNKKGFIRATKKLAQEAIDKLKEAWRNLYGNNKENVVVLNDGLEFQEASSTSVELQLNENKKTNADEMCKLFDVPPSILSGKMTEADEKAFIKYCVNNVLAALETALNKSLLLEKEKGSYFFTADTSELTKGDIDKRYSAYEKAIKNGWLQIDEVRTKENMEPLDLDFIKLGLQDVLYDPSTKTIYTPNTDKATKLTEGGEKEGESNLENKASSLTDTSTQLEETAGQSGIETAKNS